MQNPRRSDYCPRAAATSPTNAAGSSTEARPKRCVAKAETTQPTAKKINRASMPSASTSARPGAPPALCATKPQKVWSHWWSSRRLSGRACHPVGARHSETPSRAPAPSPATRYASASVRKAREPTPPSKTSSHTRIVRVRMDVRSVEKIAICTPRKNTGNAITLSQSTLRTPCTSAMAKTTKLPVIWARRVPKPAGRSPYRYSRRRRRAERRCKVGSNLHGRGPRCAPRT